MTLSTLALTFYNEVRLNLQLNLHYRFNMLMRLIAMCLKFIGYSLFLFNGDITSPELSSTLLGYLVWFYAFFLLLDMSYVLRDEIQEGTVEQMFMSPMPVASILLSRIFATFLLITAKASIALSILAFGFNIPVKLSLAGLPIFIISIFGIAGLGLLIGATTLLTKRTESLGVLIANVILFFGGTILPIDKLPIWVQAIARTLPTTKGIIMLRNVVINNQPFADIIRDGSLLGLIINSFGYFALGLLVFNWGVKRIKQSGSLGQY